MGDGIDLKFEQAGKEMVYQIWCTILVHSYINYFIGTPFYKGLA